MKERYFVVFSTWNELHDRAYCVVELNGDLKAIARYGAFLGKASHTELFRSYANFIYKLLEEDEEATVLSNQRRRRGTHFSDFGRLNFKHSAKIPTRYEIAQVGAMQCLREQISFVEVS